MDNMTILIVAILNGRTIDQWYEAIAEKVEKWEGYPTPEELPQVYSQSRLAMAKQKRERAKGNMRNFDDDDELDEDEDVPFGGGFGRARRVEEWWLNEDPRRWRSGYHFHTRS